MQTVLSEEDLLMEARALRQHKQKLEERSQVLEEQNQQLETQLMRLRKLIEDVSGWGWKWGVLVDCCSSTFRT